MECGWIVDRLWIGCGFAVVVGFAVYIWCV